MSGISGVGGSVVSINQSGSDRFQYHTREDCAITNFSINQKGRPLACLQLLPFHCALTYPFSIPAGAPLAVGFIKPDAWAPTSAATSISRAADPRAGSGGKGQAHLVIFDSKITCRSATNWPANIRVTPAMRSLRNTKGGDSSIRCAGNTILLARFWQARQFQAQFSSRSTYRRTRRFNSAQVGCGQKHHDDITSVIRNRNAHSPNLGEIARHRATFV